MARSACASSARSSTSSKATGTSALERSEAPPTQASVGILGGTFNPPHRGHLALARYARARLGLQRVLLMPANSSPHKRNRQDPGPRERMHMCELAVAGQEGLQACAIELDREAPSYTVETLERLHEAHPDAGFTFIAGADTARTLPTWRRPAELLGLAHLAVATRAGSSRAQVLRALAEVLGAEPSSQALAARVSFLEMTPVAVSSSQVRERVARGQPVEELVGGPVARFITEHGLYRPAQEAGAP